MTETTKTKSNFSTLWILLLLLLVIAASVIILKEYSLQHGTDAAQFRRKNVELNARIDSLQNEISNLLANRTEAQTEEQTQKELKRAYQLSKLAADSLQYNKDVPLAQQLLKTAQQELQASHDPAVEKIQAMLNADQQKLATIKPLDLQSLSNELNTLEQLVDVLVTKNDASSAIVHNSQQQHTVTTAAKSVSQWQQTLSQALDSIKNSVKVRKKSEVDLDTSFINIEYRRARFKLLIEQMRWAAYYGDQTVFQRSIKETQDLLTQVFESSNSNVQKFSQTLDKIAELQLHYDLPNIQATVNALQALLVG